MFLKPSRTPVLTFWQTLQAFLLWRARRPDSPQSGTRASARRSLVPRRRSQAALEALPILELVKQMVCETGAPPSGLSLWPPFPGNEHSMGLIPVTSFQCWQKGRMLVGPWPVAQWVGASCRYAKVAGSILIRLIQAAPMNASVSGTTS